MTIILDNVRHVVLPNLQQMINNLRMMIARQFLGAGFLLLGTLGLSSYSKELARFRVPFFYNELRPMRERWGNVTGTILHILEYVIIPVGFGLLFLIGKVF